MAELTIQVSDELAQRLASLHDRLPELLAQVVEQDSSNNLSTTGVSSDRSTIDSCVYTEVLDFLVARPTAEQIVRFKASTKSQVRLRQLLDKNRETSLTDAESAELDTYEQLDHLMMLLKAHAHAQMNNQ
jgi:hypothetical protein